ncbi:tyrosine-type recombinase/integrase [Listeria rustica]|uniref:Site-specific integrase n=1 Tax=Listeria rustica TaxID=2713503 RepID=A0A7W1YFF1_9LIST|nr:site-specific integrase [Listeria rustica]MBA3925519.1 site-specific integrase [Listeria rustica]
MPIKKLDTGNYRVTASLGFDPITGKHRRKYISNVKTKAEAEQIYADLKSKYTNNELPTLNKISFRELSRMYFSDYTLNQKPTYIRTQEGYAKNHLIPFFKNTNITKITSTEIRQFQKKLIKKKTLSNNSINKHLILLKKIFDVAIEKKYIVTNPCINIKKLKVEKQKMKFWTLSEFKTFIKAVEDDYLKTKDEQPEKFVFIVFYYTQYLTGLRAGESTALLWEDNTFEKQEFDINKTESRIHGKVVTTSPKTKSGIRHVSYNAKYKDILIQWKEIQNNILNSYGIEVTPQTHIFQYSDKIPDRDNFSTKKINKICTSTDITAIRLHDFRHSHVALLIDNKEELTAIKERMGHASITTTIDTYGHLFPNKQKSMSDKIDELF